MLIAGIDAHICDACIIQAQTILNEEFVHQKDSKAPEIELKTPAEIKKYLDQYVIGQEEAKRVLVSGCLQPLQADHAIEG